MVKGISKSNAPLANWLVDFTNKVSNEPELLANSATSRKDITDRISEIVSGVSKNSPYNSVSEAVASYQQKLGLSEHRKKALAQQMIAEVNDGEQFRVASSDDLAAKYELAGDVSICSKAQFRLAKDDDDYIRQELASNPTLIDDVVKILLRDDSEHVRAELARNVGLPAWANDVLQNDASDVVRNAVAERDESEDDDDDDSLNIFERIREASVKAVNKRVFAERKRIIYEDTPVCVGPNCKDVSKEDDATPKQRKRIIYEDTPVCVGPNCKDVSKEDGQDADDYDVKIPGDEGTRNYGIKRNEYEEDEEEEKYFAKLITLWEMIAKIKKLPRGSDRDVVIKETISLMKDIGMTKDKLVEFLASKGPPFEGHKVEKNDFFRDYFKSAGLTLKKKEQMR